MCLLKQKIQRAQTLAQKKPVEVQQAPAIKVEAQEVVVPVPVIAKKSSPKEDIMSLKKALTAFSPKCQSPVSENMSNSTEPEVKAEKKKAAPKPKKEAKAKVAKESEKSQNGSPTKNIAINFGKAMASFSLSHIAIPYIMDYIENTDLTLQDFFIFVKKNKKSIKSMQGLRSLLLVNESMDDKATAGYKRVFQQICELFVKNYSVNWITHSKLSHKLVYLKWRFKMLRRIRNPELFTHIC